MGCDVSHFNVSFIVRGKVSKAVSINHNCWRERRAEVELSWGSSVYEPYRWAKWLMRWSHTAFLLHHFLTNLPSDRASYTMTDWLGCMIIGQEWRKLFFYTQSFNQTEGCGSLMENQQRAVDPWWKINRKLHILDGKSTEGCISLMENQQKAAYPWWKINRRLHILDGKSTEGCGSLMENQQKAAYPWWKITRRLHILDGKSTEGCGSLMENQQRAVDPWWKINRGQVCSDVQSVCAIGTSRRW